MDIAKIEKDILATAIKSREHWEVLLKLEVRKDLTPEGCRILDEVSEYYTKDKSTNSVSLSVVASSILRKLTNPKHQELFKAYFRTLDTALAAASPVNLLQEISSLKRHAVGMRLASALVAGSSSESEVSKLLEEYQSYQIPGNLTASI